MSVGKSGKATNWPDDVMAASALEDREAQWGDIPGEIKSFDPATQTAQVQPLYRPRHNGVPVDMPLLESVPVRFARAGAGAFTFPVKAGDRVTLSPMMRSTENYHDASDGASSDARSFALSDMEAHLDGGESLKDPIKNFDGDNAHLRFDEDGQFGIRGSKDGKIKIEGAEGNIYTLLADALDLIGNDQLQIAYGSSAGTGHALANKTAILAIVTKLRAMAL